MRIAQLQPCAVREHLGMVQFFGGAAALADAFDAHGDQGVQPMREMVLTLCTKCFTEPGGVQEEWDQRGQDEEASGP